MNNTPSPGRIVIMASGAVLLLGSFLDFFEPESAWGEILFPIATLAMIFGVIAAVIVAIETFGNARLPDRVLTLTWPQVLITLGLWSTLIMVGWLIFKTPGRVELERGAGFWLMLLASVGVLVGAILMRNESGAAAGPRPGTAPPQPF